MATIQEALMLSLDSLQMGNAAQAEHICDQVLAADPENPNALFLRGIAQARQGRFVPARDSLTAAARLNPGNPDVHLNLGRVLSAQGDAAAAEVSLRACLAVAPNHLPAKVELARALGLGRRHDEAKALAREVLAVDPRCADAHVVLSATLQEEGDSVAAEERARDGLAVAPQHPQLHCELGVALFAQTRIGEAVAALTAAVALDAACWKAQFYLCRICLSLGRIAEAWRHLDQGYAAYPDGPFAERAHYFPQPRWTGDSLAGKSLRVWQPYAIGEEILYASTYAGLAGRAERVVIDTTPKLIPLFRRSFPGITFVPRAYPPPAGSPACDRQCSGLDLLRWLRPEPETLTGRTAYLHAAPAAVDDSRRHLAALGTGRPVGVSWASASTSDRRKSVGLLDLLPVLRLPGFIFINVQYGDHGDEIRRLREVHGVTLHPPGNFDPFDDVDRLAGLIATLAAVVTIPNINAHLADALGVPTLLLTRSFAQNFGLQGARSLWHPNIHAVIREADDVDDIRRSVEAAAALLPELAPRGPVPGR